jgi:oxygen-independent coproporphyrinogen-3 oxidase
MLLYIHIPFCERKCRYCDFFSGVKTEEEAFLRALFKEIEGYKINSGMATSHIGGSLERNRSETIFGNSPRRFNSENAAAHTDGFLKMDPYSDAFGGDLIGKMAERAANESVSSVFFGGGTPSLLRDGAVGEILSALSAVFKIEDRAEISAEGNPESLTANKLREWKSAGINRVSVGVQSFDDGVLRAIGRVHDAETAARALSDAADIIGNVNADLMTGLPGQREGAALYAAKRAAELGVKHVSCYELKLEKNTALYEDVMRGAVSLPDDELRADLFDEAVDALAAAGFNRYEISNFAKPGFECSHNAGYWRRRNYIGFGPSAASFFEREIGVYNDKTTRLTAVSDNIRNSEADRTDILRRQSQFGGGVISGVRYANKPDYKAYLQSEEKGSFEREIEFIDVEAALFETVMLGLRLTAGININELERKFGIDFYARFGAAIKKYETCFERTLPPLTKDSQHEEINVLDGGVLRLNRRGFEIMNMILVDLLYESGRH